MTVPSSTALSPGSVTCFFSPRIGASHLDTYSRGCAINLDHGVTGAVSSAASVQMTMNGRPIDIPPVRTVVEDLAPEPVRVAFETELLIGCGFGVSAACCLTAAFAIAGRFGLELSRTELGLAAQKAEVTWRTGIGDVAAQLCGGVALRTCQTGPLDARRLPCKVDKLFYCSLGSISTPLVLRDAELMKRIVSAGEEATRQLESSAGTADLIDIMELAVGFSQATGLLADAAVTRAINEIRNEGGHAMMIMLGRSVLATQPTNSIGPWIPCGIDEQGARYL